jgi:alanine dehydrogenase
MIIGVPRERKQGERRVAILPDGVQELRALGHTVLIEQGAGAGAGFADSAFERVGGEPCATLCEVWSRAELLVKVKEPAPEEIPLFRENLSVFCFLHLAPQPELTRALLKSKVTSLDYDLVQADDGSLPILEPMSVIAGKLSIQCGAYALQAGNGGQGVLLGGLPGVKPGRVVVIGAGVAGSNAARVARGLGAEVTVIDINLRRLAQFSDMRTIFSTPRAIEREVQEADLVIGSVLIPGALAPKLLTREMLRKMPEGSVIVDICIDQGGMCETSRPTSISDPTFVEEGVVHYCVPNMPALVPRTSTEALTNATLPWIKLIANCGVEKALNTSQALRRGLTTINGRLTNQAVAEAVGLPYEPY